MNSLRCGSKLANFVEIKFMFAYVNFFYNIMDGKVTLKKHTIKPRKRKNKHETKLHQKRLSAAKC